VPLTEPCKETDMTAMSAEAIDRLETLLSGRAEEGDTMRLDEVQGFFVALASGPDSVDESAWMMHVLGTKHDYSEEQLTELKQLLRDMMADVQAALAEGQEIDLTLYEGDDGEADYLPWCNAYLFALDVVDTDWFEVEDEGFEDLLYPMMALGGMFEQDGEVLVEFTEEDLDELKDDLTVALQAVYNYWQAKKAAPTTVRRDGDKVGRNDPCPCGSGKKFKACHGKD